MNHDVRCYRCGASLAEMSLPLSRQDECPECGNHLHVCKMCISFDANVPRQCTEDGADETIDKERLNFCDWFVASDTAFDPARKSAQEGAQKSLDALFGDGDADSSRADDATSAADELFK